MLIVCDLMFLTVFFSLLPSVSLSMHIGVCLKVWYPKIIRTSFVWCKNGYFGEYTISKDNHIQTHSVLIYSWEPRVNYRFRRGFGRTHAFSERGNGNSTCFQEDQEDHHDSYSYGPLPVMSYL